MIKFILTLLFPLYTLALTGTDQALIGIGNINYLVNPGFESGRGGWTASGGTFTATTLASNVQFGKGSVLWDSSAASQSLIATQSVDLDSNNGLKGQSGLFSCYIKVPSGTATHLLQVFVGTSQFTQTITSSSTGARTNLYFPIGTASSQTLNNVGIVSVASNEPEIIVDDCFLGSASGAGSGIGQFSAISDVVNAGAMTITATTTNPTKATTRQTDSVTYVREGKYAYITYRYVADPATGSAAGSGTYLWSLPSGLSMDTSVQANSGGSAVGSQSSVANATIPGDAVFYSTTGPSGAFAYTITAYSATQFYVYYQQLGSTGNGTVGSGAFPLTQVIGFRITIKVPIQGWSASQSAAAANQTDYGWTDGGAITIGATTTAPTKATTTINDKVRYRRRGQMLIAEYTYYHSASAGSAAGSGDYLFSLPAGLQFDTSLISYFATVATNPLITAAATPALLVGGGEVNVNSASGDGFVKAYAYDATRFRIVLEDRYATTGLMSSTYYALNTAVLSLKFTIEAPILGWAENQRAPTLIGSVTSNGVSAESIVRIRYYTTAYGTVCSGSSCTVESNISGVSIARTSTSIYTITFPAGTFSAAPVCQIHPKNATNVMGASDFSLSVPSATSYAFGTYITTTGAAGQTYGEILCIGPR